MVGFIVAACYEVQDQGMLARLPAARSTAVAGTAETVFAGAAVCVEDGRVRDDVKA